MESIMEILEKWPDLTTDRNLQHSKGSRWQHRKTKDKGLYRIIGGPEEASAQFILSNSEHAKKGFILPPEGECPFCSSELIFKGVKDGFGGIRWNSEPEPCDCPEIQNKLNAKREREAAEKIVQNFNESGMSKRHILNTFSSFQETPENKAAIQEARKYVDEFEKMIPTGKIENLGRNGLFITGNVGVGKTHLVSAIANALLLKGYRVICMTMIDLLERIKRTYDSGEISEGEVLELYETVDLLILDDIGKERATEWGSSKIYSIINGRYDRLMPTIVTTNYGDEELVAKLTPPKGDRTTADATIDRLCEMCKGIVITGESWRSK